MGRRHDEQPALVRRLPRVAPIVGAALVAFLLIGGVYDAKRHGARLRPSLRCLCLRHSITGTAPAPPCEVKAAFPRLP